MLRKVKKKRMLALSIYFSKLLKLSERIDLSLKLQLAQGSRNVDESIRYTFACDVDGIDDNVTLRSVSVCVGEDRWYGLSLVLCICWECNHYFNYFFQLLLAICQLIIYQMIFFWFLTYSRNFFKSFCLFGLLPFTSTINVKTYSYYNLFRQHHFN